MKEQELRERGGVGRDIGSAAQRAMGNDLSARQYSRDVWIWPWLQDISQDVRFAIRMLLKDRRFTAAAVIALALGIAVNNSVFTIVNAALSPRLAVRGRPSARRIRSVDAEGSRWACRTTRVHRVARGGDFVRRPERRHRRDNECQRRGTFGRAAARRLYLLERLPPVASSAHRRARFSARRRAAQARRRSR